MDRSDKRIDNRGMSLVELLLAVVILAIIVVPLLHAFVSSARVNRKSRLTAKVTTLGQDVMEGLKAYSVEDLAYEFDYPAGGISEHPQGFQLIAPKMIGDAPTLATNVMELKYDSSSGKYTKCSVGTDSSVTLVGGSEHVFKGVPGKTYYFAMTNVSSEDSASSNYKADIFIKLDPQKYTGSGVTNAGAQHNDQPMADLSSMDTTKDAFFLESGSQVNTVYSQLDALGAAFPNHNAFDISKVINVKAENDAGGKLKVTYEFIYSATGASSDVTYPSNPALSAVKYTTLDNVYLFYMPSYNSTGDIINFTNSTNNEVNFNLVKRQITSGDGLIPAYTVDDYGVLLSKESGYHCTVNVTDVGASKTTLKTNVKNNLAALIPGGSLSSNDIFKDTLTGVTINDGSGGVKNVAGEIEGDRIYDVTIEIYEAGAINSGLNSGGTIPADKKLTTLKGNMN